MIININSTVWSLVTESKRKSVLSVISSQAGNNVVKTTERTGQSKVNKDNTSVSFTTGISQSHKLSFTPAMELKTMMEIGNQWEKITGQPFECSTLPKRVAMWIESL